jgi:nitroreductase
MEGFLPNKVDEVLGLRELGLKSTVILTLGYRDTEGDSLSTMKKVRRDNLFIRK